MQITKKFLEFFAVGTFFRKVLLTTCICIQMWLVLLFILISHQPLVEATTEKPQNYNKTSADTRTTTRYEMFYYPTELNNAF